MIKQAIKRSAIRLMTLPPLFRLMNKALNTRPIIFTLHRKANPDHGIGGHDPAMVRQQLEYLLKHGYRMVTMDVIDAWVNGEDMDMTNSVAFTFDDGYRDQVELIREVFLPLGVPASMFLITDFIDGKDWPWDARINWLIHHAPEKPVDLHIPTTGLQTRFEPDRSARRRLARRFIDNVEHRPPEILETAIGELAKALDMEIPQTPPDCHAPLSWDDARALEKQGMRFGSHSISHYIFSTLDHEESERQIRQARERIHSELAYPLSTFCYPIGLRQDYTGRELKTLAAAGHTSAVTMTPGIVERPKPGSKYRHFVLNRYGMPDDMDDFIQHSTWIERAKDHARAVSPRTLIRNRYGSPRGLLRLMKTEVDYRLGRIKVDKEIDWSRVKRLVFICHGNVCRSPFAEAVAKQHGLPAISFGLKTDQGTRANPIASRVALEMGVDMTEHASLSFDTQQLRDGDLLLGMEPAHLQDQRYSHIKADVQTSLLGLVQTDTKAPYLHDPYGLSDEYHRRCLGRVKASVEGASKRWKQHTNAHTKPEQAPIGTTAAPAQNTRARS